MTGKELLAAGLTQRQLSHWTERGWIVPENGRPGSGKVMRFSEQEARIALVMAELTAAGVGASRAAELARTGDAAVLRRLADAVEAVAA